MAHKSFWRTSFALAVLCSSALLGGSAAQASFSAEFVFGDSLSDNGNLFAAVKNNFHNVPVAWRAWTYPSPVASNTEQYYFSK